MSNQTPEHKIFFIWGLKRSGIHYFSYWLYRNLGAEADLKLIADQQFHPQLQDGYHDSKRRIAFINNCGRKNSRNFKLGDIEPKDFAQRASSFTYTIFGIEDANLHDCAKQTLQNPSCLNIIVMRDPLNNIASRLRAASEKPIYFPTNKKYIDLYEEYCNEILKKTQHLKKKIFVSYNAMMKNLDYRNRTANKIGVKNRDITSQVSTYGGGSSFSGTGPLSKNKLNSRFKEQKLPDELADYLCSKTSILEFSKKAFQIDVQKKLGRA